jgi:hypothetical protein
MNSRGTLTLAISVFALLLVVVAGCSNDDSRAVNQDNSQVTPQLVSVFPADGSQGVSPSTHVSIRFSGPMDTSTVNHHFYFAGGATMHEWMDSLEHGPHGGMHGGGDWMDMDHMYDWLDSIQWHGDFHWNGDLDSCYFMPDSLLLPQTDYMFMLFGDIRGMNGHQMRMGADSDADSLICHFTTGE